MKLISGAAILISCLLLGCYQPDGENFVDVKKPDGSGITIDLDKAGDTLFIDQTTLFKFSLHGRSALERYDVLIDNETYFSTDDPWNERTFYINAAQIGSGTHNMKLQITTKSNSGSLADKLGVEKIIVSREWVLVVDLDKPAPLEIVSMDTTQGTLTIRWNSYKKWNFKNYRVVVRCPKPPYYGLEDCRYVDITNPDETEWTDDQYVGGVVYYRVDLITPAQYVVGSSRLQNSKAGVAIELLPEKKIKVSWTKSTFYKNVSQVQIFQKGIYKMTMLNAADTVLITDNNFGFGMLYKTAFEIVSTGKYSNTNRQEVPYGIGKPTQRYVRYATYNKHLNQYFMQTTTQNGMPYFSIFDQNFQPVLEKSYSFWSFNLSENGEHLYATLASDTKSNVFQVNPSTLDTVRTFSISSKFGTDNYLNSMRISNTNLMAFHYTRGRALCEMPSGKLLHWQTLYGYGMTLSHDGKYYVELNRVYQINEDHTLTLVGNLPAVTEPDFVGFREDVADELIIMKQGNINIVKIPEMTVRKINVGSIWPARQVNYDPQSGCLIYNSGSGPDPLLTIVVDVNTGDHFVVPPTEEGMIMFLVNSKIITSHGYVADLDFVKSLAQ